MLKFVVTIQRIEQLEILLGVAKTLDLTPELGAVEEPRPSSRRTVKSTRKAAQSGKGRPKRYPPRMSIRISRAPVNGAPKLLEAYQAIEKEFGALPFEKRLAKAVIAKKFKTKRSGLSTYVTELLDKGHLLQA